MNVEVGGGLVCADGWVNLDPVHGRGRWRRRAQDVPWPTGDATVARLRASHVLEHVPAGDDRVAVLNEAHRVLAPGGTFEVVVPLLVRDDGAPAWQAVADPTHVSFWVRESFDYFTQPRRNHRLDVALWDLAGWRVADGWEGHALLVRP